MPPRGFCRIDEPRTTRALKDMFTFIIGPLLALLPQAWRGRFNAPPGKWKLAGVISGALESFAALAALVEWYSYSVTHWAEDVISSTAAAHPQGAIPFGTEGFAAVVLLLFHPLTWLILYCGIEGVVRLLAAGVNGTVFGILPFYLLEWSRSLLPPLRSKPSSLGGNSSESDLLTTHTDAEGEILEIRSLKPKEGWIPPKIVRFRGVYYRLFQTYQERAKDHRFVFVLRRLSAGVYSWTVIDYSANFRWADAEESNPKR